MFYLILAFAFSAYSVQASQASLGIMTGFSSGSHNISSLVKRDFELTYYNPSTNGQPGMSACEVPITDNDFIAALSFMDFGYDNPPRNSRWCNKCIRVYNGDVSIAAKVVDKCEACKYRDVDLSPVAFNLIADPSKGRIPNIKFEEVDSSQCTGASSLRKNSNPVAMPPVPPLSPPTQSTMVAMPIAQSSMVPISAVQPSTVQPTPQSVSPSKGSTTNPLVSQMFSGSSSLYSSCLISLAVIATLNSFFLFA